MWNIQGVATKRSLCVLKVHRRCFKPAILILVETKISRPQTNIISLTLGFEEWVQVEVTWFNGSIWVFWQSMVLLTPMLNLSIVLFIGALLMFGSLL